MSKLFQQVSLDVCHEMATEDKKTCCFWKYILSFRLDHNILFVLIFVLIILFFLSRLHFNILFFNGNSVFYSETFDKMNTSFGHQWNTFHRSIFTLWFYLACFRLIILSHFTFWMNEAVNQTNNLLNNLFGMTLFQ